MHTLSPAELAGPYRDFTVTDFAVEPPCALHPHVAIMNAHWRLHGFKTVKGESAPTDVRATLIVRRDDEGWRYAVARFMVPLHATVQTA